MGSRRKIFPSRLAAYCVLGIVAIFFCGSCGSPKTVEARVQQCEGADAICGQLVRDVNMLRDPTYGYIRAGYPRYMSPFGRDSLIIGLELKNYDPNILKNTLRFAAQHQAEQVGPGYAEPGKIFHWADPDHPERTVYYSIDSTPLFVHAAGQYFEKTHNRAFIEELWPAIERALEWCAVYGDADHDFLIEYAQKEPGHMFHQAWKDGDTDHLRIAPPVTMVEVQGYHYVALIAGSNMASVLGHEKESEVYLRRAKKVRAAFLKKFWIPGLQRFAFAIDGKEKADPRAVSNVGQLLFTGILDGMKDKQDAVVKEIFAPDMWTEFGIRTYSKANADFDPYGYHTGSVWPHDNWMIAQGLRRYGYADKYNAVKSAQLRAFKSFGNIPELYAVERDGNIRSVPEACVPQGWASGALLNFLLEK